MFNRKVWSKDDGHELPVHNEMHYLSLIAMGHLQEAPSVEAPAGSDSGAVAARANGGPVRKSEVYLAGEHGPEFTLPAAAAVNDNGQPAEGDSAPVAGVRRTGTSRSNRKRPRQD